MFARPLSLLLALFVVTSHAAAADEPAPHWIVVTAPEFREALTPLCDHRRADGLQVTVVKTTDVLSARQIRDGDAGPLKEHIQKLCQKSKGPAYVLLVGVVKPADPAAAEKSCVPTLTGMVGRMKGEPSDHGFSFRDKEPEATVAVGRFQGRTEDEVRQWVQKTIAFERDRTPGAWRNRVTLLIGNPGGFTPLEKRFGEMFIQSIAATRFDQVHPLWTGRGLIHAPVSPFCVPDDRLHDVSLRYLEEGQIFALYLGHSGPAGLWSSDARFLDRADWAKMKVPHGPGVLFSCGCFGCQQKGEDGYALTAIRNPGGPVAVIGAQGESYGAMGQLAADGLLECLGREDPPARLADYWLAVKGGLAGGKMDDFVFFLYDQGDGSRGRVAMDEQRKEHLEMWTLLGDPALRLPLCRPSIRLESATPAAPGGTVEVTGTLPPAFVRAVVRVTLERPVGSKTLGLEALPEDAAKAPAVMAANHERANSVVLVTAEVKPADGRFRCTLKVPAETPWTRLIVRATVTSETDMAVGVLSLPVKK
jgi:hypothetical protein